MNIHPFHNGTHCASSMVLANSNRQCLPICDTLQICPRYSAELTKSISIIRQNFYYFLTYKRFPLCKFNERPIVMCSTSTTKFLIKTLIPTFIKNGLSQFRQHSGDM